MGKVEIAKLWCLTEDSFTKFCIIVSGVVFYQPCVLCRISYFIVIYLYVSFSGLITSGWEERANFSAIYYS